VGHRRPFQKGADYVFCQGHWNSAMRDNNSSSKDDIRLPSNRSTDDWMDTIV
jgi:hypothetical protein